MVNFMLSFRCLKPKLLGKKKVVCLERNVSGEVINIPPRKRRGPIDLLQALSHTVKAEANVQEYRFQQGGIFSFKSKFSERIIALSMDSGRRAAKWVVTQNPNLFLHKNADPYIKAFAPPRVIDENTPLTEEKLLESIEDVKVEDAIKIYKMLKEKNIDVSNTTKQLLLEMVCFFNNKNKSDEAFIDTKYFEEEPRIVVNTWKKNCFAEDLFLEMIPSLESYSALILGLFKYNSVARATKLYEEAKEKGIQFGVDVYNVLLQHATEKAFDHTQQEKYIIDLLKEMNEKDIAPNLDTLNSALKSVAAMKKWVKARDLAVKLFSEFTALGIKPSLATYYYLIDIFSDRLRTGPAFSEILSEMEKKSFVPRHPDDFKFFRTAMKVALGNFRSITLANKVHDILMTGGNKYFLNNNIACSDYYRLYIKAAFNYGSLDKAIELLETCSPQNYIMDQLGLMIILKSLKKRFEWRYLSKVWPSIRHQMLNSNNAEVYEEFSSVLSEAAAMGRDDVLVKIAKEVWQQYKEKFSLSSDSSEIMTSFLKTFAIGEEKALADEIVNAAVAVESSAIKFDFESLNLYIDLCITNDDSERALACLEYAVTLGLEQVRVLAEKIKSKLKLKEDKTKFVEHLLTAWK